MRRVLLFICLFSLPLAWAAPNPSALSEAEKRAESLHLSQDIVWKRLLHMQRNILGLMRSAIDDKSFFLSRRGSSHPDEELKATLEAFYADQNPGDDSAACRYPARYAWLDEKLNLSRDLPKPNCARFENWKTKLVPRGVSLIFASYYFNNPASMYGHTFLKLKREGYDTGQGLMDYTVNYAAEANTTNGAAFAFRGLAGGYKGKFTTDPYYVKIQKYNNIESRDLWEYELNFSSAEINRLVQHMWEIGPTAMTYYFFNKNCSYQLLPMLEAARPSLDLSSRFVWRTVPLDTLLETLKQPDLIEKSTLRPSHVRVMMARREELTESERDLAKTMSMDVSSSTLGRLGSLEADRQAKVLDSAYDLLRYKAGFFRNRPMAYQEREQQLLLLRKDRPVGVPLKKNFEADVAPPQNGHGPGQGQVMFGVDKHQSFEEISVRGALHDQEADPVGYVPGSQLEMLHFRGRYVNQTGKLSLEQAVLVEVFCLSPRDPWVHPPSWRVWTGADVARDLNQDPRDSLETGVKGGSGVSLYLSKSHQSIWYAMWRAEAVVGHVFDDGYRVGGGGQSGVIVPVGKKVRLHAAADALRFPMGNVSNVVRYYGAVSYTIRKNLELRLIGERQNSYQEARSGITVYW